MFYAIAGVALILSQAIPEQAGKSDNSFIIELSRHNDCLQLLNACSNFNCYRFVVDCELQVLTIDRVIHEGALKRRVIEMSGNGMFE